MTRTLGVLSVLLSCGLVLAACAQAGGDDQPIGGDDDQGDVCGDGACTGAESPTTCSRDCGNVQTVCGDGQCNGAESAATCPRDCGGSQAVCGDGTCNGTETASSCPGDCSDAAICGDGQCNGTETQSSCPGDCGGGGGGATCGDFVCDVAGGECASCFLDCFLETEAARVDAWLQAARLTPSIAALTCFRAFFSFTPRSTRRATASLRVPMIRASSARNCS